MNVKQLHLEALKTQDPKVQIAQLKILVNNARCCLPARVNDQGFGRWPVSRCRSGHVEFEYCEALEEPFLSEFLRRLRKLPGIRFSVRPALGSRTKKPCLLFVFKVRNRLRFGQFLRKTLSRPGSKIIK